MPPLSMVDPIFKVAMDARPSNYEVTHISWERPDDNLNWYRYVLVRNPKGYPQTPDDGDVVFPDYSSTWSTNPSVTSLPSIGFTDDAIFRVTSVSTGGVVTGATRLQSGAQSGVAVTSVSPVSTSGVKGKGLVISVTPLGSITIVSGGGDYAVNDIVRLPGNSLVDPTGVSTTRLSGSTLNTQLGVSNTFHVYDNSTYATTANPGISSGTNPYNKEYSKYYYSLFAYVAPSNAAYVPTISNIITLVNSGSNVAYNGFTWVKLAEASSVVVHKNTIRSTKDVLLDHLPAFYSNKDNANQNKDLSDFLSLFAFHLDVYLAETKAVFTMADPEMSDEVLLKEFLKQYGSELKQITDLVQARKVLANIIRNYSLQGSTLGLKNLIEAYTGNSSNQVKGINLLPDYNTSSFVESIGNWYPKLSVSNSYDDAYPYDYTLDPMDAAIYGTTPVDAMVAQLFDASLVGTTNVNISPNSSFLGKQAYITDSTGSTITTNYETTVTASAITSTTSTTVKVNDTSKLKLGAMPLVVSGTGVFSPQTVITYIDKDGVTFKVNIPPSTAIAVNDKIALSSTITSGILSLHPANLVSNGTGTVTFYSGFRQGVFATAATVSTTDTQYLPAVAPNVVKVGDYVTGHSSIPGGTRIVSIEPDPVKRFKLNKKLTGTIPSAHILFFSPSSNKLTGAASDMVPVLPNMPYAFGASFNANNATTRSTVVGLDWYNQNGDLISSSVSTATAPTATSPYSNSSFAKTWYPTYIQDISPSTAAYVAPTISVVDAYNTARYCVDSAMLVKPVNVIKKSRVGTTATLTTDVPHNFFYKSGVGGKVAVVIPDDSTFNTTNASITNVVQDQYGNYKFSYTTSTNANVSETTTVGYAASYPMITDSIGGVTVPLVAFQDARETTLEVVANRVNLVLNPSFDYDTSTIYDWVEFTSVTPSIVDTTGTSDYAYSGSKYLSLEKIVTGSILRTGISQAEFIKVTANKAYSASCRIRNATSSVRIGINWYDSSKLLIQTDYGSTATASSSLWVQIKSENKIAPANAAYAKLEISTSVGSTAYRYYEIDGVMFEQYETVRTYFNGDFDGYNYLSTRNSMWEGTPGQSRSHLYKNRVNNIDNIDTLAVRGINYA